MGAVAKETVDELLHEAKQIAGSGEPAALTRLATWLPQAAQQISLPASLPERRLVLGGLPGGPAIGLRWFPPGEPTTVHSHGGWGVLLVLEGSDRYERWESTSDGRARLAEVRFLATGDTHWFAGPPHDLHRQVGTRQGALELVLVQNMSLDHVTYLPEDESEVDPVTDAILAYDWEALAAMYHPKGVLEMNVPQWRFQLRGSEEIRDYARREAPTSPRLGAARVTRAASSVIVEVEMHDGEHLWREVHIVNMTAGAIVSHTVYCTGIWSRADVIRQHKEAPMVRP